MQGFQLTFFTQQDRKRGHLPLGDWLVEEARNGRYDVRPGDVILALIDKGVQAEVKSVEQFNAALGKVDKNAAVTLLIRRGENQTFVTIKGGQ